MVEQTTVKTVTDYQDGLIPLQQEQSAILRAMALIDQQISASDEEVKLILFRLLAQRSVVLRYHEEADYATFYYPDSGYQQIENIFRRHGGGADWVFYP